MGVVAAALEPAHAALDLNHPLQCRDGISLQMIPVVQK